MEWYQFMRSWQIWRRIPLQVAKFFGVMGLCVALVVGCGGSPNPPASSPDAATSDSNRVTVGTTLTVRTVDPADAYELISGLLLYNMGDRLYTYEPGTTNLVPQLATELPTISDDGLIYTIPLREGVTFHDGTSFNAEAMAFSIQRFMENEGRPAFLLADRIASVEATGDYELTITLTQPFAAFSALLAFSGLTPVPPASYEIGTASFKPDSFIGTGPYKLAEFATDRVRLDANKNYWGDVPANDGLDIQIFTSPANLFNAFKTGDIDIAYQTLDPDQIRTLEEGASSNGWQVIEAESTVINYLTLNQKQEPFSDLNARKAIAALIDRKLLVDRVFQGQAEPLYSLIPTSLDVYKPVFEEVYGDGNTAEAKKYLEEGGFSESNPLAFELWYLSSSTTDNLAATTLKASMEQQVPGLVSVTLNSVESATAFENLGEGLYPSFILNWYPDFYDPDTFIEPFMSCDKGSTTTLCEEGQSQAGGSFYYSDRSVELVDAQRKATDPAARKELIGEIQDLLAADVPYIPLWQEKDYAFAQSGITNFTIQPTQQVLFWQISK
jgi:peptide/nickel transport system substrate-binding protein